MQIPARLHTLPAGPICLASGTVPPPAPSTTPKCPLGPQAEVWGEGWQLWSQGWRSWCSTLLLRTTCPVSEDRAPESEEEPQRPPKLSPPGPLPSPGSLRLMGFEQVTVVQAPNPTPSPPPPAAHLLLAGCVSRCS